MKIGDKQFIENALNVYEFDKTNIDANLIQYVNMGKYGVATNHKPLLLTCNLQSCIALIAYSKDFFFLSTYECI